MRQSSHIFPTRWCVCLGSNALYAARAWDSIPKLVDATSYRSQRNRELEGIGGVSAQFAGVAVSASTREKETKMLQQGNPLG
jgi:hypothetical protein